MPVLVDPELRRAFAAVGEAGVIAGAGGRIDPEPDRPARIAPSEPLDLADRVEIDVDRRGQEDVEVPFRDVRAREADLLGRPPALEGSGHLARRAGIDPDETAQDLEDARVRVRLEREAEPMTEPGAVERGGESAGVLGEPRPVVDEERRPVLPGERLRVLACDRQAAVTRFEARPDPPRRERDAHAIEAISGCVRARSRSGDGASRSRASSGSGPRRRRRRASRASAARRWQSRRRRSRTPRRSEPTAPGSCSPCGRTGERRPRSRRSWYRILICGGV